MLCSQLKYFVWYSYLYTFKDICSYVCSYMKLMFLQHVANMHTALCILYSIALLEFQHYSSFIRIDHKLHCYHFIIRIFYLYKHQRIRKCQLKQFVWYNYLYTYVCMYKAIELLKLMFIACSQLMHRQHHAYCTITIATLTYYRIRPDALSAGGLKRSCVDS